MIVTGSRIRQNPVERVAPVQTATLPTSIAAARSRVADYLQRLPISGSAINRANNASGNLGFPPDGGGIGAGASEIDLRYLTSKRVLVLVDGRRWVRGSSGSGVSGAVDLNTIPTAAIERIEVLQDGASPIYGSDAIAGVVNVITQVGLRGLRVRDEPGRVRRGRRLHAGLQPVVGRERRQDPHVPQRWLCAPGSRVLGRPRAVALRALRRVGLQLQRQLRHSAGPLHLPRSARRRSGWRR